MDGNGGQTGFRMCGVNQKGSEMKIIQDGKGRFIGQVIQNGNLTHIRDGQGRPKGHYVKTADKTYDERGRLIGHGDQLLRMLR